MKVCTLCGVEATRITRHHWIPRTRHGNKRTRRMFTREEVKRTSDVCQPCHDKIHSLFSEKELERSFNTLEKLLAHPEIRTWVKWREKHPGFQGVSSKRSGKFASR
ncbi:MAG: hypothetical protein GY859_03630 [Desulfobacterales bacterium]|nr:hypothetical protein [Desulfobacterales bacterium]